MWLNATGQYLYACINKTWRDAYMKINRRAIFSDSFKTVYSSTCTERRAAFASTSRLLLADESGLDIDDQNNKALQRCAGLYASQRTLLQANQLGMNFNNTVVNAAAESGDLESCSGYWQLLFQVHQCLKTSVTLQQRAQMQIC
jgi:hypothetical protein